jgi:hypothetical protein
MTNPKRKPGLVMLMSAMQAALIKRAQEPRKPGRPRLPDSERFTEVIQVRCTKAQREKLDRLGGVAWIRERIDRAKEQT